MRHPSHLRGLLLVHNLKHTLARQLNSTAPTTPLAIVDWSESGRGKADNPHLQGGNRQSTASQDQRKLISQNPLMEELILLIQEYDRNAGAT
jgi:hypothetical protein